MARNDPARVTTEPADRARLRAGAESWRALAAVMVASALVVALIVSVLALVEAVVSPPSDVVAQRSPGLTEPQRRRATVRHVDLIDDLCTRREPALCAGD
jgi:hypothetical protein